MYIIKVSEKGGGKKALLLLPIWLQLLKEKKNHTNCIEFVNKIKINIILVFFKKYLIWISLIKIIDII